tara:strand:- start:867 stop:1328 length:462 start_codon:yes stop_codon:yes gene_type:complete
MWLTGTGKEVSFTKILEIISSYTNDGAKIYIGCDSQKSKTHCVFATSICIHGADNQNGGIYFYNKLKTSNSKFPNIMMRVLRETELAIELGTQLKDLNPNIDIELHLDINPKKNTYTSKFIDMLAGYARGAGFEYKLKPDAWASSSVADKHSK